MTCCHHEIDIVSDNREPLSLCDCLDELFVEMATNLFLHFVQCGMGNCHSQCLQSFKKQNLNCMLLHSLFFLIDLFLIFINIFYLNYFTKISSLSYCYNYVFCHNMIIYYMYITTIIGKTRKKKLSSFSGRINGIKKF